MTIATQTLLGDLRLLKLENDFLAVSILPDVGAKILTLFDKRNGRQILWENPRIQPQRYPIDANFDNYWCGGWDDVFPTADACVYQGEPFPNVGELRSLNWKIDDLRADQSTATASLSADGPISPVKAFKTIVIRNNSLEMDFSIENQGPLPLDFLWGTHPAFAVEAGTRLLIPARVGIVQQATDPSLGSPGECYAWPMLRGTDMSVVPGITAGTACGHYATDLTDGWFAIETAGKGIVFEFSLETCPHLWLWLVYGGWRGYHHAIVEPWTSYPVNLTEAVAQGRHRQLLPGGIFRARIRCTTYSAPESAADALKRLRVG